MKKTLLSGVLFFILILSSCTHGSSVSDDSGSSSLSSGNTAESSVTTIATTASETVTTSATEIEYAQVSFETVDLTAISGDYLKSMVIIGDSIAKGFSAYSKISASQVLAEGSVGARNINDFKFSYRGVQMTLNAALESAKPKYIFMSMGMNDIRITDKETFCKNYSNNISTIKGICPDAKIIVVSISPVSSKSDYTTNASIDEYNLALSEMVKGLKNSDVFYANTAQTIKNEKGMLHDDYSSGDGIHLAPIAYDYMLSYMISMLDWIR